VIGRAGAAGRCRRLDGAAGHAHQPHAHLPAWRSELAHGCGPRANEKPPVTNARRTLVAVLRPARSVAPVNPRSSC
jgi:hypothetical protein